MKYGALLVCLLLMTVLSACGRKPAYSDIDVKAAQEGRTAANANRPAAADLSTAATDPTATTPPAAPPPANPPAFFDNRSGAIKDVPAYPGGIRSNVAIGSQEGADVATMVYQTRDPAQKIAAFYNKEIKRLGWYVITSFADDEQAKWELRKGAREEAVIRVGKTPGSKTFSISITRITKPAAPPAAQ